MNKTVITILLAVILTGGFFIFFRNDFLEQKVPINQDVNQQTDSSQKWESKIDDQASVAITVAPIDISPESKEWKFNIVMDTHSVELDQDMIESVILVDDIGKEYKPIAWEGPVGGHHREGVLKFNQITPIPKSIELKISGIGDVIRNFSW
jgi:hypothetical protein